jgi:diguanylate cyclase (GGDEF)-like protein
MVRIVNEHRVSMTAQKQRRPSSFPTERAPELQSGTRTCIPNIWEEDETDESHQRLVQGATRGPMRPSFTVLTGIRAGEMFSLDDGDSFYIGRASTSDLLIEDQGVSRVHCRIGYRGRDLEIQDLNSTNGTLVNGVRVTSRTVLREGDRIQLGPSTLLALRFVDEIEDTLGRKMVEASTRDPLTNLHNRRYFHARLEGEVSYARRHRRLLACIVLDLDFFKVVNDTYGHKAGDDVLKAVAGALAKCVRSEDLVARFGGEEFSVLLRVNHINDARYLAERIRSAVKRLRVPAGDDAIALTVSAGVAELSEVGHWDVHLAEEGHDLVALADRRLYRAKSLGRDRVCVSD